MELMVWKEIEQVQAYKKAPATFAGAFAHFAPLQCD
jgi:hypothetical protein